ncbi:hypothetical protein vseg_000959 [Gypsophila vaccaria]
MSVEEYYVKFMELSANSSDLKMSDEVLAAKFGRGLAIHFLERMSAGVPTTVRDVFLKAGHAQRLLDLKISLCAEKKRGMEVTLAVCDTRGVATVSLPLGLVT